MAAEYSDVRLDCAAARVESRVADCRPDPSAPASTPALRVLLTAFHPFAGDGRNPSAEVLAAIVADPPIDGLVAEVLPVVYADAGRRVEQLIAEHRPAAWVGLGLHAGATAITLERRATNADDASVADNAGDVRRGVDIETGGPTYRPATLPLDGMASAVGGRVAFSDSAGRFVCNHTFYRAAAAAERLEPRPAVGFVHLPWPADWPRAGVRADHTIGFDELVKSVAAMLRVVC